MSSDPESANTNAPNYPSSNYSTGNEQSAASPEWITMKTRVITRAFYEDAYLDFFIKYYAALGFDNIVILKADTDKFPDYKPPNLDTLTIPGYGNLTSSARIDIVPVVNEGNNILKTHYSYYADKAYDWILNIDADEFLIIDLAKYPGGIKEYIYKVSHRLADERKVPSPESVQQIKFRWMCINKLNSKWPETITPELIANPGINLPSAAAEPQSLAGYFLTQQLEAYKFVKSMCNTKWANPETKINAHFFFPIPTRGRNFNVLDGDLRGVNDSDPRHYPRNGSMLIDGYILHINTRSLANAITKCLVTKLRDNKKIKDPARFREIINSYIPVQFQTPAQIQGLKREFADQLNSKSFFPQKIRRFNSLVSRFIKPENIYNPLSNMIATYQQGRQKILADLVITEPIVSEQLEWTILRDLCLDNDINPDNMRMIIELF